MFRFDLRFQMDAKEICVHIMCFVVIASFENEIEDEIWQKNFDIEIII